MPTQAYESSYIQRFRRFTPEGEAYHHPKLGSYDRAVTHILRGLAQFAECHQVALGSPIGDDPVTGEYWASVASGLIGLLGSANTTLNRGDVDGAIRQLASAHGLEGDAL